MIFNKELKCIKLKTLDQDIALKAIKILQENEYEPYIENGYEITDTVVNCIKISAEYCKDKEDAKRVVKILNDTLDVYAYASRIHINVNNPQNHKKQAVVDLSKIINISLDNFYVIGDSINDYGMIEAYNSAVVKKYNKELEILHPKVCESVEEYIEELMKI
jgi:hydroxymethylpyrimidine pyrophosphatase-like HAD family hydrolase